MKHIRVRIKRNHVLHRVQGGGGIRAKPTVVVLILVVVVVVVVVVAVVAVVILLTMATANSVTETTGIRKQTKRYEGSREKLRVED